jgi:hypothetical protein
MVVGNSNTKKVIVLGDDGFAVTALYLIDRGHDRHWYSLDNLSRRNDDVGCDGLTPIQSQKYVIIVVCNCCCCILLLLQLLLLL